MKTLLVLFVAAHLVLDLAMPSLPGAFRFNPDESAVGVRVAPVHVQDLRPAPQTDLPRAAFERLRLEMKLPVEPQSRVHMRELTVFLPRRDPSTDRSPQAPTEDH